MTGSKVIFISLFCFLNSYALDPCVPQIHQGVKGICIDSELKQKRYIEIKNPYVTKNLYACIYEDFDTLIESIAKDPLLRKDLEILEQSFRTSPYHSIFCKVPVGYRDRTTKSDKDKKKYFQFSSEYYTWIKQNHLEILDRHKVLKDFFDQLAFVEYASKLLFKNSIGQLAQNHPKLAKVMYGGRPELTVVIKVLSYDYAPQESGTSPHYDKSGLTLILDNDDQGQDHLVLCPYKKSLQVCKLKSPKRMYADNSAYSSALFIPGSLLRAQGVEIMPTPHAVHPFHTKKRHAMIAFALVPSMDVSHVKSMIINKKDLPKEKTNSSDAGAKK